MIWNEELSASLDQSGGVVVFHRIELTRNQQLAQVVAEKIATMVDQSEKALDIKMGGTGGWGERADGTKGDKRGEQTQERRGRGERTRGARGSYPLFIFAHLKLICSRWRTWWSWWSILARTRQSNARPDITKRRVKCMPLVLML